MLQSVLPAISQYPNADTYQLAPMAARAAKRATLLSVRRFPELRGIEAMFVVSRRAAMD